MLKYVVAVLLLISSICGYSQSPAEAFIKILGVAQDGGYPHMGCQKRCCKSAWRHEVMRRNVVSLALVDPESKKWWLFEATPDIRQQLHDFQKLTKGQYNFLPEGIFITHAHIGHYTGLMELGKEVMGAKNVPVYTLPKLANFLETNGPWSQLVNYRNIEIRRLTADSAVNLTDQISVTAFTVPHRDEFSETAGFRIVTAGKKYLFIPDINKWEKWDRSIVEEVKKVDIAMVDATFFNDIEIPGIKFSSVPHPLVTETMHLFENSDATTKSKIHFIHFNHTNSLLWDKNQRRNVQNMGFNIARQGATL